MSSFVLGFCKCGCNEKINVRNARGFLKLFSKGHNLKIQISMGVDHWKWNGGISHDKDGYIDVKVTNHPFANNHGYYPQHRLVYEQHYNCILLPYTDIDHGNKNKQDNRIENLRPVYRSQHTKLEKTVDHSKTICLFCKRMKSCGHWHKINDNYICKICYNKKRFNQLSVLAFA